MKHSLIFSREILYIEIVLCLNILRLKAVNYIAAIGKHELALQNLPKTTA